jgi:hypothetical protein
MYALNLLLPFLFAAATLVPAPAQPPADPELDAAYAELSRTVQEGDFEGYAALYHPDAVLVNKLSGESYPIATALAGWKPGFDATRDGQMKASVEFRITQRLADATTAHDTGMFRYVSQSGTAEPQVALIHFESLYVKKDGAWLMVMEYQKSVATEAEWEAASAD